MEESESLCPRARYLVTTPSRRFLVKKDPAVMEVAKKIVAGIDRNYSLYPDYNNLLKEYGEAKLHRLIRESIETPGFDEAIQTEMDLGGIGLFGGLSKDKSVFIFSEWTGTPDIQLYCTMTAEEARDIVAGRKKFIEFKLTPKKRRTRKR